MVLDIRTPPKLTGNDKKDIAALNEWCGVMLRNMMAMFRNIDSDNITELSSNKLVGMIDASLIPATESEVTIE